MANTTGNVPRYTAVSNLDDSGAYTLIADGRDAGELLFYDDAHRIVRTFNALGDHTKVMAAMSAEALLRTTPENVQDVLAALIKLGEVQNG